MTSLTYTRDAVARWFFGDYLPRWVTAGSEGLDAGFITRYWAVPLWVSLSEDVSVMTSAEEVVAFLRAMQERLRAGGYTHTDVPDRRITVFTPRCADVSVIWSRCRDDGSEIERLAVAFTVMETPDGWRAVAIRTIPTAGSRLDDIWPTHELGALT